MFILLKNKKGLLGELIAEKKAEIAAEKKNRALAIVTQQPKLTWTPNPAIEYYGILPPVTNIQRRDCTTNTGECQANN